MGSPERGRSYGKRDVEDSSDVKSDRDDGGWEGSDKRKHRSSKSRKSSNAEEGEGLDSYGRRRSSGDKSESRKRSNGSSKAGSDDDNYDTRKERSSKQAKKKQEVSTLEKLSSFYQDGELESRQDSGDKLGGRAHIQSDENERRKISPKLSEHESSRSGTKSKEEKSHDGELEMMSNRDSRHLERRESSREKGHGSSEQVKSSRRRWDDADVVRRADENHQEKADLRSGKASDSKHESTKERSTSARNVTIESKRRGVINCEKGNKSDDRGERRVDNDRSRSKGRSETLEDDRGSPVFCDDRSGREREKIDNYRQQRTPTNRDATESLEKSAVPDENGKSWMREKIARDVGHTDGTRTSEKSGRRHREANHSEMDHDRSIDLKRKEPEKDGHREDRSKGRDVNCSDRNREWEDSKELWERSPPSSGDKESKDGDIPYDHGREWELPKHGRDRNNNERPHGRSGNRKDGSRGEAVKTSNFSNENYDVIEIRTKPDYGRAEIGSNFVKRTEVSQQSDVKSSSNDGDWPYMRDDGTRTDLYGSGVSGEDLKDRYLDDGTVIRDLNSWKNEFDYQYGKGRGQKGAVSVRGVGGNSGSQPPYGNQEAGSFGRAPSQGVKGNRVGRGGRGRPTGRDNQQVGLPLPIMGSPFGPLGMPPPGPMQPFNPSMSPAPGPPISPGVFIPPFSPPMWPGARGIDMNMLGVPPGLPVPPGPLGPRFPPNMVNQSNPSMYFSQAGPERGMPPSIAGPGFNSAGPMGRGGLPDKAPGAGGWVPPRNNGPPGKAPSRGEQNDYSQNFVDTGMRPQNFIRELELTNFVEDYPKLRELIQKKDEIVTKAATLPMYFKCDLREFELSPEFFGTKFDVILVDPPWEEYAHRAPGVADHTEYWTFEEILNLKIEAIADTPSFIFLWVGDGVGLEQGRQCLKKWGFRRCEDICWVQTNKSTPSLRHDSHTLFQHSKEHCLMGIKGTVRRSTDGHIIHANIDTDVIIAEEPPYGSTQKPEDMYRIVEHFALGRRRIELFGEDHNIRSGWLTVGKGLSSSNFNAEAYVKNFADMDGKVWQGGAGRNPPPEAPHLVLTTPEIESLRPKSPMKNQQQLQQQQSTVITLTTPSRREGVNSPQNPGALSLNQEASSSCPSEGKVFDMHGYGGQTSGDYLDFESHRPLNLL